MKPSELFDVSGKSALITGASGAFGAVAARTLAEAGCRLTLTAGNADALESVAGECRDLGAAVATVNARPETEAIADAMVEKAVEAYGRLDILVVASGINRVGMIEEMAPDAFADVMDANVTQSWLLARAATRQMKAQGDGGKIVLVSLHARDSRPPGGLHRLLRVESGGRRHHEGARLRAGADGHHRERGRADRLPLGAHGLDVHTTRPRR